MKTVIIMALLTFPFWPVPSEPIPWASVFINLKPGSLSEFEKWFPFDSFLYKAIMK